MTLLERALLMAVQAHAGQRDKAGAPYILHPIRVMLRVSSETEMIAALLHDVVEDSSRTLDDLRAQGLPEEIVEAVDCLTKREGDSYEEFIQRLKNNSTARKVKLADLEDNMDVSRLDRVGKKELDRIRKYHRAWMALREMEDEAS